MKIYVATRLSRAADQRLVAQALRDAGHEITYDWSTHGSLQESPEAWSKTASAEARGVTDADAIVALLPGGFGTHVEIGLALGAGVPVVLVGDQLSPDGAYRCIFYSHPGVRPVAHHLTDWELTIVGIMKMLDQIALENSFLRTSEAFSAWRVPV